jgi:hypothetical protein
MSDEWVRPTRRYEAPGGEGWIEVRALTEGEALERESAGVREEYLLVSGGMGDPAVQVRRSYDLRAMAEHDFRHSVVAFRLPEAQASGEVVMREGGAEDPEGRVEVLLRMVPPLSDWVWSVINEANYRQPEQRAEIEQAKKN